MKLFITQNLDIQKKKNFYDETKMDQVETKVQKYVDKLLSKEKA